MGDTIFCSLVRRIISVCNLQSMKSPLELNSLLSKFFCYITWLLYQLIRRDTGRLANEAFTSNPIVSWKQQLNGLKITNWFTNYKLQIRNWWFDLFQGSVYVAKRFSTTNVLNLKIGWQFSFRKCDHHLFASALDYSIHESGKHIEHNLKNAVFCCECMYCSAIASQFNLDFLAVWLWM